MTKSKQKREERQLAAASGIIHKSPQESNPDFDPFNQKTILSNSQVLIRLPSDNFRVVKLVPNTVINLGKFGSFRVDDILDLPFGFTYEMFGMGPEEHGLVKNKRIKKSLRKINKQEAQNGNSEGDLEDETNKDADGQVKGPQLRIVPALDTADETTKDELLPEENNKNLHYDPEAMTLSMDQIEALKRSSLNSGREVIDKMIQAHSSFDKKTTFSQEKYVKRKEQKFLRRFQPNALGSAEILELYTEKEARNNGGALAPELMSQESLALMLSLANVRPGGTYFVVDDTSAGIIVIALLERMQGKGTIVVGHSNEHANLDALKYINASESWIEDRVKTINWLDFLHPEEHGMFIEDDNSTITTEATAEPTDTTTTVEPTNKVKIITPYPYRFIEKTVEEVAQMRPHQRGQYFRRKKRQDDFTYARSLIDSQAFDGCLISTDLDVLRVLDGVVNCLRGSAPVVIYSPHKELLTPTAQILQKDTRVLAPSLMETRVRKYQTLPGRMHPVMTMRAGGGYILWGTRVLPTNVDSIGANRGKKRKAEQIEEPKAENNGSVKSDASSEKQKAEVIIDTEEPALKQSRLE